MSQNDELDVDIEESADEFGEEPGQLDSRQAPPKKKSGGGLMAVLLLLILGGGGVVAAPFLGIQLPFAIPGLPAPAPVVPQEQTQVVMEQQQPTVAVAPEVAAIAPEPAPAPRPEMSAVTAPPAATFMPASIDELTANAGPVIAAPGVLPGEEDPLAATVNDPAAPIEDPLSATVAAPSPDMLAPETAETQAIPFPEADPLSAPNALDVAEQVKAPAIAELPAPAEAQTPIVPAVSDKVVEALESRIAELEKTLADLKGSVATKADIEDIRASLKTIEKTAAKSLETAAVKTARKEVENFKNGVMPDVVRVEPSKPARAGKAAAEKSVARQVKWVLKSAKPGMAWVAEKGSNELKTVVVGDILTGIGQVTGIVKDSSGRWVVNGTKGYIGQ